MRNEEMETKNDSRMLNARYGMYAGQMCLFTHHNPKNGKVYGEDIYTGKRTLGAWVPYESVRFV